MFNNDTQTSATPDQVITFWREAGPALWFAKNADFDLRFRQAFITDHLAAARRERDAWMDTAEGALALILLLDQFPRNAFRGTAHMFATDPLALFYTEQALAFGHDLAIEPPLRPFMYLPLEHAEDLEAQIRCVALCRPLGGETLRYAEIHHEIISRFGRFPHRNDLLGRVTTTEEDAFLRAGGFSG